tara:strand:- start:522 stop:1154 length:633 start_codon:yes stop_codon:yes gene_type:complete
VNTEAKNKLIIISSPSGAGKTTLCKLLIKKMQNIKLSISYTSRSKRLNEINGKDYFFVTKKKFQQLKKNKFFIETASNFNNLYGSPFNTIKNIKKNKKHILFDIDWKGARKIRYNFKKENIIDFFILPPSKSELKRRLIKRGRDNNKEINLRLSYAIEEMKHYNEYKHVLINENVHKTVNEIKKIIQYNELIVNQHMILHSKLKKIINIQ